MVWAIIFTLLVTVALAAFVVRYGRGWSPQVRPAVVAGTVLLIPVLSLLFWKETLLAIAIIAVTLLAVAVMFQKVPMAKAVQGAVVGFLLIFAFSWLAFTLADVFLYGKTDVSFMPAVFSDRTWHFDIEGELQPALACAVGVAAIVVAGLLPAKARAFLSFPGLILILCFGPQFLETISYSNPDLAMLRNPFFQGTLLIAAVILTAHWLTAPNSDNQRP